MVPALNRFGEIPDAGPPWSCAQFGSADHDYQNCPDCKGEFERQMEEKVAVYRAVQKVKPAAPRMHTARTQFWQTT